MKEFEYDYAYSFHRLQQCVYPEFNVYSHDTLDLNDGIISWRPGSDIRECKIWAKENLTPRIINFMCRNLDEENYIKIYNISLNTSYDVFDTTQLLNFKVIWQQFCIDQ